MYLRDCVCLCFQTERTIFLRSQTPCATHSSTRSVFLTGGMFVLRLPGQPKQSARRWMRCVLPQSHSGALTKSANVDVLYLWFHKRERAVGSTLLLPDTHGVVVVWPYHPYQHSASASGSSCSVRVRPAIIERCLQDQRSSASSGAESLSPKRPVTPCSSRVTASSGVSVSSLCWPARRAGRLRRRRR